MVAPLQQEGHESKRRPAEPGGLIPTVARSRPAITRRQAFSIHAVARVILIPIPAILRHEVPLHVIKIEGIRFEFPN